MFIDLTLSMTQTALIVLRMIESITCSWWLVMLPTIIWCVVGLIATATGQKDDEGE